MKNKIISLFLVLALAITLISCQDKKKVTSIEVVTSTVPSEILIDEVDEMIKTIKLNAKRANGEVFEVSLEKSMIDSADYAKLANAGSHQVKITYEKVNTTLTLNVIENANGYKISVVYPDQTPVQGGLFVQLCKSVEMCLTPVVINNEGNALVEVEEGNYYVHLLGTMPEGYTYNPNIYMVTKDNKELTIELIKIDSILSGDGSSTNPYVVASGCYNILFDSASMAGVKYFSFTASKSGKVQISSLTVEKELKPVDPFLGFLGQSTDFTQADVSGNNENQVNFNYEFDAVEGQTYIFAIMISSAPSFPTSVNIQIISK